MSTSNIGSCTYRNSLTAVCNYFFGLWFQSLRELGRISGISVYFPLGWKAGKQHTSFESFAAWYMVAHHNFWHHSAVCA